MKESKPMWRNMGPNRFYGPVHHNNGRRGWSMEISYWPMKSIKQYGPFHRAMLRKEEARIAMASSGGGR